MTGTQTPIDTCSVLQDPRSFERTPPQRARGRGDTSGIDDMACDGVDGGVATQIDVAGMGLAQLEARLIDLARQLSSGTFELLVLVGEVDARGGWATWGALSCAAWLAEVCDIEICTARTQVRVARAMRQWSTLHTAMRNGDVSYAKARTLAPHLSDDNVDALVNIATRTPAGRLGAAIAAWTHRHENDAVIADRQHRARSCSWRTEPDGMVTLTARLEPAVAGAICAVIDHHMTITNAPAGALVTQQRADALATIITTRHTNTNTNTGDNTGDNSDEDQDSHGRGRVNTELLIHIRDDGATLTNGTPIPDHAITKLLPDAFISLLLHDTQRTPIDASPRRRSPTRRQRRVLDERQPECAHPGCHAQTFLQYDHIRRYTDNGTTTLDNLQRLCGPHNRARETPTPPPTPPTTHLPA